MSVGFAETTPAHHSGRRQRHAHAERIRFDEIRFDGPEANRYRFTCRGGPEELAPSIQKYGLLTLPLLREHPEWLQIVCGFRRLEALRLLGRDGTDSLVLTGEEAADGNCLRRSILENLWQRGFNEVEKALIFTRLHDEFPDLLPGLSNLPGLENPVGEKSLTPYRFVLSLPEPILHGLAQEKVSFGQVQLLRMLPEHWRLGFYELMTACEFTLQESRRAAEWLLDLAWSAREGKLRCLFEALSSK